MQFLKREKGLTEKLDAVNLRIAELEKRKAAKTKDMDEAKTLLGQRIADGAMEDNDATAQAITHSRKAFERTQDSLDEVTTQLEVLTKERERLVIEQRKALVREAPAKAEAAAKDFNSLLQTALEALAVVRNIHGELLHRQTAFNAILRERQEALKTLAIIEGLKLTTGLGELALAPVPHRHVMQVSDAGLDRFIMELIGYEKKLLDYRAFTQANPDHGNIQGVSRDRAGFGAVGDPARDKTFKQVWEISQHQ